MTTKCKCGGKLRRSDIIQRGFLKLKDGSLVPTYEDTDPKVAHWECPQCGNKIEQKKRQAK